MNKPLPDRRATASFEAPLEMLTACHHRIDLQCATLVRLANHHKLHGADAQAQSAASAVMRYFDTAARHHHEDEERDLFPALIEAMAGSDAVCLRELTAGLTAEHRRLEMLWQRVRVPLLKIAAGEKTTLDHAAIDELVALYGQHTEREDKELLPMAARLLDNTTLERVGRAMRERRGVDAVS